MTEMIPSEPDQASGEPSAAQDDGRDFAAEIEKLRRENAKWRTQYRDVASKLSEIEPLIQRQQEQEQANQTDAQKWAAKVAEMESRLKMAQAEKEMVEKRHSLSVLAAKAGIPADLIPYLDVTQFDFEDPDAIVKTLTTLVKPKTAAQVGPSNPGRSNGSVSDEEMRNIIYGGAKARSIFGG